MAIVRSSKPLDAPAQRVAGNVRMTAVGVRCGATLAVRDDLARPQEQLPSRRPPVATRDPRRDAGPSRATGTGPVGDDARYPPLPRTNTDRKADVLEKAEAERSRLLAAATQVLQGSGWWGFKVESVLRRAGLSTRSFYRHFEKKNDLLLALLEIELGGAAISLRRSVAGADTPWGKIRAYVDATLDLAYREDLARAASLFASHWRELLPDYPEAIERCTAGMRAPLVEAITDGNSRGEFQSQDPVADARAIFHLVSSMTADQAASGGATSREELENILMPFISRALGLRGAGC